MSDHLTSRKADLMSRIAKEKALNDAIMCRPQDGSDRVQTNL
jgi:hypothetical protein